MENNVIAITLCETSIHSTTLIYANFEICKTNSKSIY